MKSIDFASLDLWPVAATLVFVGLDILTGWMKAVSTGTVSSAVMRQGLFHKVSYFVIIVVFIAVEALQKHFSFWPDFPTTAAICAYICVTEIVSLLENLAVVNPEIRDWPIVSAIVKQGKEDASNGNG